MSQAVRPSSPAAAKPLPFLEAQYCKGCGRCIEACPKHCIAYDDRVDPRTGLIPVVLDLELCNGCGLCELSCGHDAIHVVQGKAILDESCCVECGLCVSRCRPGALLWAEPA